MTPMSIVSIPIYKLIDCVLVEDCSSDGLMHGGIHVRCHYDRINKFYRVQNLQDYKRRQFRDYYIAHWIVFLLRVFPASPFIVGFIEKSGKWTLVLIAYAQFLIGELKTNTTFVSTSCMNFFVYFMHFVLYTLSTVHLCATDTRLINATCLLACSNVSGRMNSR